MKRLILAAVLAITVVAQSFAASNTSVVRKTYKVIDFDAIEVTEGIVVNYTQGSEKSLKVTAPKEVFQWLSVRWNGSRLVVCYKNDAQSKKLRKQYGSNYKVVVDVQNPNMQNIFLTTGAVCTCKTPLRAAESLKISVTTGAVFNAPKIEVKKLYVDVTTGANVNVADLAVTDLSVEATTGATVQLIGGTADATRFSATTGATIDCSGVTAASASGTATTSATIRYNAKRGSVKTTTGASAENR